MIFWLIACFRRSGSRISGQKSILEPKNKVNWKIRSKLWVSNFRCCLQFSKIRKMRTQKWPKCMIFGPIACFRRRENRRSGQNRPRSSEMMIYIENVGHIKNHQNFKILFWSQESEKPIFRNFPGIFTIKMAGNPGMESRVRRPGNLEWDDLGRKQAPVESHHCEIKTTPPIFDYITTGGGLKSPIWLTGCSNRGKLFRP